MLHRKNSKEGARRTAVAAVLVAAMAAPLVVMPHQAQADLASSLSSGSKDYGPAVTITTPQYADVVAGSNVSIAVAVRQRTNPVRAIQMFVDGHMATPGWVQLKSLQSSKFNWDTTRFNNGPHKLSVRVIDTKDLIGQAEITVYVNNSKRSSESNSEQQSKSTEKTEQKSSNKSADSQLPHLKWLGVKDKQILKGEVDLRLEVVGDFGAKYILLMLNSADNPDSKPALRSWMVNQPPYSIPFDTTKVNDGLYVLDALAYDGMSNQGEAPRLNIGIANNTINPTWFDETDSSEEVKESSKPELETAKEIVAKAQNATLDGLSVGDVNIVPPQIDNSPQTANSAADLAANNDAEELSQGREAEPDLPKVRVTSSAEIGQSSQESKSEKDTENVEISPAATTSQAALESATSTKQLENTAIASNPRSRDTALPRGERVAKVDEESLTITETENIKANSEPTDKSHASTSIAGRTPTAATISGSAIPSFPEATLNTRIASTQPVDKSTFTANNSKVIDNSASKTESVPAQTKPSATPSKASVSSQFTAMTEAISDTGSKAHSRIAFLPDLKQRTQRKDIGKAVGTPLLTITVSPANQSVQSDKSAPSWPAVYVAKDNEPLAKIAARYGLPTEIVAINNRLKESAQLKAGQEIHMPRSIQVAYDGVPVKSDVGAIQVGGTSVAAFRFLFEQQGGKVSWDPKTQTVHAKNDKNNTEVTLSVGSNRAVVNQKDVLMDVAAFLLSGRTMVPVRLFEKSLNAEVTWEPSTGRIFVAMANE